MERHQTNNKSRDRRKEPAFLKRNGPFFSLLFLVWMGVVFFMNITHVYFGDPLPNELQSLQAEQSGSAQQGQTPAASGTGQQNR